MKFPIIGYPDDMYGEYIWFGKDNNDDQDVLSKDVFATTHRENENADVYDIDIFHFS